MSAFTKRVACPEGADLGFGGFPQQAKIRLGSTQTLLATIVPKIRYARPSIPVPELFLTTIGIRGPIVDASP